MIQLTRDVVMFLEHQGFGIVSTLDANGSIHCAAKGMAGIDDKGEILIMDLYRGNTLENLKRNPVISVTAVDEHKFCGYTLKGKGRIVERAAIEDKIIKDWEARVLKRISKRIIANVQGDKKSKHHPEVILPLPEYLIVMEVEEIVNLTPQHITKKHPC